jgi:hypothetical protein
LKAYGGVDIDRHFLDLSTSWRLVVSFTPLPAALPPGKSPQYPLDRRLGGPPAPEIIIIIQFFITYVPSQQLQGQLQTQHGVDTGNYIMEQYNIKEKKKHRQALEKIHINAEK